jgi:glucan 1,3-beta-glucosidase
MSIDLRGIKNLTGLHSVKGARDELISSFTKMLDAGIHGISFSPYSEGQSPGDAISEEQIRDRLRILKPYTQWIRTFSCTEGNEQIPLIAKEMGLKTLVGAWLGADKDKNRLELERLIEIGNSGYADIVAVGNEVLYREEMSEEALLDSIHSVKRELPDIQVGYVDAYYEFCNRPALTNACDLILANCYPFWEGCHADYSLLYIKDMYQRVLRAADGKHIIISETGWPNAGNNFGDSVPSISNALRYFINIQNWVGEEGIDMFYFSSFDEPWKTEDEGEVGAFWGLWDPQGRLKYIS